MLFFVGRSGSIGAVVVVDDLFKVPRKGEREDEEQKREDGEGDADTTL